MRIQAFLAKLAVEAFDEGVLHWLAGFDEPQPHAVFIGPKIKVAGDELGPLVYPDRLGIPDLTADQLERSDDILAAIAEPAIDGRRVPRSGVNDRQHPQLAPRCQLVVDEVQPRHRCSRPLRRAGHPGRGILCRQQLSGLSLHVRRAAGRRRSAHPLSEGKAARPDLSLLLYRRSHHLVSDVPLCPPAGHAAGGLVEMDRRTQRLLALAQSDHRPGQ